MQRLLARNANLKNTIIDVINKNLDIEPLNLSYYNYMALADFISSFDLKDIEEKIHYQRLLEMNNFTKLLPNMSTCNLLSTTDNPEDSRIVFSTYQSMLSIIQDTIQEKL